MVWQAMTFSLLSWLSICPAYGQGDLINRIDSITTKLYYRTKVDTNYITRPDSKWIVKLRANLSGAEIATQGMLDEVQYKSVLNSAEKETFSISVAYRGLGLGLSVNPAHLHGKDNDLEFNLSSYSNKIGGEVTFHSAKTFSGTVTMDDVENYVGCGLVSHTILSANGYYVFNHRRFSYPAALSQSYHQLRSAGSWMLGLSFWGGSIKVEQSEALNNQSFNLYLTQIGIGGGYGYNLVVRRHWLFHLSALSAFVVYGHNRMESGNVNRKINYNFPEVIITGRGAIIYNFSRYFTGISMITSILNIGASDKAQFVDSKWRGRLFFGIML